MTNQHKQHIRTMRADGISVSEIARTIGLPRTTVQSFVCKEKTVASRKKSMQRDTCKNCGESIRVLEGHRPREFCSDYCRLRHWRSQRNRKGLCV